MTIMEISPCNDRGSKIGTNLTLTNIKWQSWKCVGSQKKEGRQKKTFDEQ